MKEESRRVVLPVETKVRELDGKFWLALHLAEAGFTVVLGQMGEIKKYIHKLDPDVYFFLGPMALENRLQLYERLREAGRYTVLLYTEGGAFRDNLSFFEKHHSSRVLSQTDLYFAWGRKSAGFVLQNPSIEEDRVRITGNPEFDLLHSDNRAFYKGGGHVDEDLNEFVLVNTNFLYVNSLNPDRIENDDIFEDRSVYQFDRRLFSSMVENVERIAGELPDTTVVVRPHPGENHDTYREKFNDVENIRVIYEGSVRYWLMAADVMIHNNCTTGIEGVLAGTPVLAFAPEEHPEAEHLSNRVSYTIRNRDELLQAVKDCTNGNPEPYLMDEQKKRVLKEYIENLDGQAARRITGALQELDFDRKQTRIPPDYNDLKKEQLKGTLRNWFGDAAVTYLQYIWYGESMKQYLRRTFEVFQYVKKGVKADLKPQQKFPHLNREELTERLRKFQRIKSGFDQIEIDTLEPMSDAYEIYESS